MAKRGFTGVMTRSYGARDHELTVLGAEKLTQHFIQIELSGGPILDGVALSPSAYLRFWFPDPHDPDIEQQRAYTLVDVDEAAGTFAIQVVLHEPAGPAAFWAQNVKPGDTVVATALGSTTFDVPPEPPAGYLLVGDSASIPAINAIMSAIPATVPIQLYVEEHSPDDRAIPITGHPRLETHWVERSSEASLAAAIESRDWSNWAVWAAPESGSLKHLRTRLGTEFGFPKAEVHARAYWYEGRPFGKRRSKAESRAAAAVAAAELEESLMTADAMASPSDTAVTDTGETSHQPQSLVRSAAPRGEWRSQGGKKLLEPLRRTTLLAAIAQALITLIELAPFVLLVELSRRMLRGATTSELVTIGVWAIALIGSGVLLTSLLALWLHLVDARFSHALRQRTLNKMSRLPLGWFAARGSGGIKSLAQDDPLALHYRVTHAVPDAVAAVVAPVAVLIYLFAVEWRIALLLLLPIVVYVIVMAIMMVASQPKIVQHAHWIERMNAETSAYLEAQPVIRVFGDATTSSFGRSLANYSEFLRSWQQPLGRYKTFMDLVNRPATFLLLIITLGTALVSAGSMDPIDILPFLLLGTGFGAQLVGVGYGLSGLQAGMQAAPRIQQALDEPELVTVRDSEYVPAIEHGAAVSEARSASFRAVTFSYHPDTPVLRDVSFDLVPGGVTALVGPSGSGKSTLAALLARFHDVDTGVVCIGGRDIRTLTSDDLYQQVGFVFQDTQLIHGTVRENIALARPDAPHEVVVAAAKAAHIHQRIEELPDGYATVLDGNVPLSGGEQQRLAIARALVADTPILVLDEATAFADPESEYEVQKALSNLTARRTVLVIAHRLHTVVDVDQIVVLDGGEVAEIGTHAELLGADGRYRRLWDAGMTAELVA